MSKKFLHISVLTLPLVLFGTTASAIFRDELPTTFVPGGTHSINITTELNYCPSFSLAWNINCHGKTDRINCMGFIFEDNGQTLPPLTIQARCQNGVLNGKIISACKKNTHYNVNFSCVNQTTLTATAWAHEENASESFICK